MDKNTIDPAKSIPAFYAGQSIFLTGATGFLGKVYIEKILRSCPDVREIFILMRPKKGLNLNERLEKMLNLPLFDKLREEQPSNFKKLIPVLGDTSQENLGLSAVDRQNMTEKITIIIHSGATVKFNNSLKYAILTNTRSTRDICILAESMKNLMALVYVSTAYTHLDNPFIEEKMYSPVADWRKMIKVAELLDEHILSIFTAKCLNNIPNTYIFSKNLAESVIQEYSLSLPCAIVRPSIVVNSLKDPFPGWIDNFNGLVGLSIAGLKGLLQVLCASCYTLQNTIPVDTVINTIILVTWKLGLTSFIPGPTLFVVNCTLPDEKCISFQECCNIGYKIEKEIPLEGILWIPNTLFTESLIMHYVLSILWHILPAILIDLLLKLLGYRPINIILQRSVASMYTLMLFYKSNDMKKMCQLKIKIILKLLNLILLLYHVLILKLLYLILSWNEIYTSFWIQCFPDLIMKKKYVVAICKLHISFLKQLCDFFTPIDSSHYFMHKSIERKIYVANRALQHFSCNEWKFDDTNNRDLMSLIPSGDREIFSIDLSDIDIKQFIRNGIIGNKKYLLHEDMNRLSAAKAHFKRVELFVTTFKAIIGISILWMMYKWMWS